MRSLTPLILIIVLLFAAKPLFAQETVNKGDIIIHIHGSGPDFMSKYQVDIYRRSNSIKIIYAVFDSIRVSATRKDTAFARVSAKYMKGGGDSIENKRLSDAVYDYFERYSVYDRDSVTIAVRKDTAYNHLLERVAKAHTEDLLQTERNKNRNLLDGVHMAFTMVTASGKKVVGARSPRQTSHPLLYSLLSETMKIGRTHKLGPFLHRKSFGGY
ncbi:hypothetical protein [Mucilaginibacter panaciglaebae]|uniref:Uncharacterized protein n=1 Tax=Mucilaginibacter panaciglaebae TaxID=502331 RepID=A0ABP7WSW9_9SPHI